MIYISHLMPDTDLQNFCEQHETGIEVIEFGIGNSLDHLEESIVTFQEKAKPFLHRPLTVHGPFLDLNPVSADSEIRKVSRKRFESAYHAARKLKATKIIYHSCFMPNTCFLECWIGDSITFWREFIRRNEDAVPICIENVWEEDFAPLCEVVKSVNHPSFRFCLDIGHAHAFSKYSVLEWIRGMDGTIGHVHLHDNDSSKDSHMALGEGTIPIHEALLLLNQNDSILDYTIENNNFADAERSWHLLSSFIPTKK